MKPNTPKPTDSDEEMPNSTPHSTSDVCENLLHRYSNSSSPQHRHLCASACAMRSLLADEGVAPTPSSYFGAVVSALRTTDRSDSDALAALSAFLSVLLPLLDARSMGPEKAEDASREVMGVLEEEEGLGTPAVRALVKCLGFLVLCLELKDWGLVKKRVRWLFKLAVDRRPKVRRCAQESIEKAFIALRDSKSSKKAGKFLIFLLQSYISEDTSEESRKKVSMKSQHIEAVYMLNTIAMIIPVLHKDAIVKLLPGIYMVFDCHFTLFTRHVLKVFEVMLEHLESDDLLSDADRITSSLLSYMSSNKKNPIDTLVYAASLLRNLLNKIHHAKPNIGLVNLPVIFSSLADLLHSEVDTAKHVASILVDFINCNLDCDLLPVDAEVSGNNTMLNSIGTCTETVGFICTLLENVVSACSGIPNEHILVVTSELFLKLGGSSYFCMRNIVLKIAHWLTGTKDQVKTIHLQECLGSAIIAMGPARMLDILPIVLNKESLVCSNAWLIPFLREYVCGAQLKLFIEHIAPLAKSLNATSKKGKQLQAVEDLRVCSQNLWTLLPAFCHYPTDILQSFDPLAQLLLVAIKKDQSSHETIAVALQLLVNENIDALGENKVGSIATDDSDAKQIKSHHCYSKKIAYENIKVIASCSISLLEAIVEAFFVSPPQCLLHLKEAIQSLSSVIESSALHKIFVSLSKNIEDVDTIRETEGSANDVQPGSGCENAEIFAEEITSKRRCSVVEIGSCFVLGADEDLIYEIYDFIRHSLEVMDESFHSIAYSSLSRIMKEHSWFSLGKADQLVDLLLRAVKSTHDTNVLRSRFKCIQYFLVHLLKKEDEKSKKMIFLILNEIILTLKDSNEEVRKTAYDMLLALAHSFKEMQSADSESHLHELFTMIMGYFSGSSPQIISGAVAALSLLIYKDADLCLSVPNLLPSVLSLLKGKATEVIKAALGFLKVLVSSLQASELSKLLPDIAKVTLPWSSVSKNHFKSKVKLIFEIIMRKCGVDSLKPVVPERYMGFIKSVEDHRQNDKTKGAVSASTPVRSEPSSKGGMKRKHGHTSEGKQSGPPRKYHKGNQKRNSTNSHPSRPAKGGGRPLSDRRSNSEYSGPQKQQNNKRVRGQQKQRAKPKGNKKHLKSRT